MGILEMSGMVFQLVFSTYYLSSIIWSWFFLSKHYSRLV